MEEARSHLDMHYSEVYADERAREMEAAAQRRMGCSPFCRMFSRVTMKCNGREGRMRNERMDYAMAYPTAARTVTIATTNHHHANAHVIPPEPSQTHTTLMPGTPYVAAAPPARAGGKPRKKKKSKRVRFTPAGPVPAGPAPPPHVAHVQQDAAAGTSSAAASGHHHHDHPAGAEPYSPAAHGYGNRYGRYAPSPLTRWEMLGAAGTPRRYEYFSGEYRWCYPTSVSDGIGICCIATDANRLTTIFSEENPNACTIV